MLTTLALLFAAPQSCADIREQCRACTESSAKQHCSNIGIACQPVVRICRARNGAAVPSRPRAKVR